MPTLRDLAAVELRWNGLCYVWGGIVPGCRGKGTDCSGINWAALEVLGVPGPDPTDAHRAHRTAQALYDWCQAAGTTCSVAEAERTIGAWGFVGRDGKIHHIVTSLGNGSTIEAANTKDGVGVFRWGNRFDLAGFCPALIRTAPVSTLPSPPAQPPRQLPVRPTLAMGSSGRSVQVAVGELMFVTGVDLQANFQAGVFDHAVLADVVNFQRFLHLPVTGQFDAKTWAALDMTVISKGAEPGAI